VAAAIMQSPFGAVFCLTLANFGMDLAVPVAWAGCLEAGGNFGGTATAFMNTGATISAFISPLAAAWMFTRFGSFRAMLMSAGAVYLIASLLWLKVDPRRSFDSVLSPSRRRRRRTGVSNGSRWSRYRALLIVSGQ
jgi:ACS family glucarate transporter-like MFS transporter